MTRLRKRVATRLKDSQNTFALLTTFNEVDMWVYLTQLLKSGYGAGEIVIISLSFLVLLIMLCWCIQLIQLKKHRRIVWTFYKKRLHVEAALTSFIFWSVLIMFFVLFLYDILIPELILLWIFLWLQDSMFNFSYVFGLAFSPYKNRQLSNYLSTSVLISLF